LKAPLLLIAVPLCLAFAGTAQAQDSTATATLQFSVQANNTQFTWVNAGSSSVSQAEAADFLGWQADGFGGFSPLFATPTQDYSANNSIWGASTAAAAFDGLNFSSSFEFDRPNRSATLSATSSVVDGGFGRSDVFTTSAFDLAAGATVTFTGNLTLAVSGNNTAFASNYTTTDLYSFAEGLMAIGFASEARRSIGPLTDPYVAGPYSLAPSPYALSVTITNTGSTTLRGYLDAGVAVYTASAVPEPETYALMVAGLAAIGFMVRRRSSI
jgi:PEP-CTERM motif